MKSPTIKVETCPTGDILGECAKLWIYCTSFRLVCTCVQILTNFVSSICANTRVQYEECFTINMPYLFVYGFHLWILWLLLVKLFSLYRVGFLKSASWRPYCETICSGTIYVRGVAATGCRKPQIITLWYSLGEA